MANNSKEVVFFLDSTWPPTVSVKNRYDENGWQVWDFTVATKDFGRIKCSFYPQQLEKTFYAYFGSWISGKPVTCAADIEAIDAKYPGLLSGLVEFAIKNVEDFLPD